MLRMMFQFTLAAGLIAALSVSQALASEKMPASATATSIVQSASKERGVANGYHIGAGDILQIMVWKEPDASVPSVVVRPDGKIAIPLLKDVEILGLTPIEVEAMLTAELAKFIPGADVTVIVTAIHSRRVYLVGAVKKEGPIELQHNMSVLQALSEAGGLTDYAKRKKIYVLRTANGVHNKFPFNYDAVIRGERMPDNILVQPDDIIVVPH